MSRYIDEHRGRFGVEPICRVLDVSASAYHQRATGHQRAARLRGGSRIATWRLSVLALPALSVTPTPTRAVTRLRARNARRIAARAVAESLSLTVTAVPARSATPAAGR